MTKDHAQHHWREGAERALQAAEHLMESGDYELERLAQEVDCNVSEPDRLDLRELSSFAAFARYGDESWLDAEATKKNVLHWLDRTRYFFNLFSL